MKTIPLDRALSLTGNNQPLNIYQDSTCSGAWLVISPEHPDEMHSLEIRTETFAVNHHDNTSTIKDRPEDFDDKEDAQEIKAHAALLAHFYNHGPELVSVLAEVTEVLDMVFQFGYPREGSIAKRANDLIAKVSTVKLT